MPSSAMIDMAKQHLLIRHMGEKRISIRNGRIADILGIGGFYEASMAMILVTFGVALLAVALNILSADAVPAPDKQDPDDLLQQITTDERLIIEENVLDAHHLRHLDNASLETDDSTNGFKIILTEVGGEATVLLINGTAPSMGEEVQASSMLVNVRYSQDDVRAATLTVWMW